MSAFITIVDAVHAAGACYLATHCARYLLRLVLGARVTQ
jgi:hypothetical protein